MTQTMHRLSQDPETRAEMAHKAAVLGTGIVGGVAIRRALAAGWERSSAEGKPPLTPDDPAVSWTRALVWAVISGLAVGLTRMLVRRATAGVVNPR
jgi:hypothetical protein